MSRKTGEAFSVSASGLLMHFERIATAPGGVTQLRELILALAVRGKLVPQDPSDEPASMLLQGIRSERERLIAEGKIKRNKPLPPTTDEESPFELPQGWGWIRLGNLLRFRIGRTPPSKDPQYWSDSGYSWVSIADMDHFGVVQQTQRKLTERGAAQFGYDPLLAGTLLMSFKLTIGKIAVLGVPAYHNEAIVSFYPLAGLDTEFMKFVLPSAAKTGSSKNALMGQTLNTESLSNLILAIPPTNEQSRIVARVDELMRLCDELEAKGQLEAEQHASLLATLLGTLTDSATPEELVANWQRVAEHFDLLLDRPEAVDALEQTILQLAVRGLLVPQDPSDEPASALVQKVHAKKSRLIAEGKIKRHKLFAPITDEEKPFGLPVGWQWVRLANLLPEFQNGASSRGDPGGRPITVLRLADIKGRRVSLADTRQIPIAVGDIRKYRLREGDILITRVNGSADIVGQFTLCDRPVDAIYCDHFIRMRVDCEWLISRFAALLGESDLVRQKIKAMFITTAGQKTVNQGHIGSILFALPPLTEQSRIVARVTELRRLCGDLREHLAASQATQSRLAEALVESVASA
jgi:type I restriction enzyme S subunit